MVLPKLRGPLLAIESSCDETAAAVLTPDRRVLSDVVHSQTASHAPYGGVVPEIASREHLARITVLVERALSEAGVRPTDLGAVAATAAPGLIGGLLVGLSFAKGLAQATGVPFLGVHHIEGHLVVASLDERAPKPPFIGLIASGGHSALYLYKGPGNAELLGETRDDAAGEAFDKTAKLLGLGYPGGAVIDRLAEGGDPHRFPLPVSLKSRNTYDFSFSGLKTAVRVLALGPLSAELAGRSDDGPPLPVLVDLCASVRRAIVEALLAKAMLACRRRQVPRLVVGGGVAANSLLRSEAVRLGAENDVDVYVPPRRLCTDNAVMIGAAALAHYDAGYTSGLDLVARAYLPIGPFPGDEAGAGGRP